MWTVGRDRRSFSRPFRVSSSRGVASRGLAEWPPAVLWPGTISRRRGEIDLHRPVALVFPGDDDAAPGEGDRRPVLVDAGSGCVVDADRAASADAGAHARETDVAGAAARVLPSDQGLVTVPGERRPEARRLPLAKGVRAPFRPEFATCGS